MQALAGVRAETTPHALRREQWLTADLRYGGCERHLLPLIDADLNDPVMVRHCDALGKSKRVTAHANNQMQCTVILCSSES